MFFILILIALLIIAILYYSVVQYRKTLPSTDTDLQQIQGTESLSTATSFSNQDQQQPISTPMEYTDFAEKAHDLAHTLGGLQASFSNGNTLPDGNEIAPFIRYCREVFYYIQQHRDDFNAIQDYFHTDLFITWQQQYAQRSIGEPQQLLAHLIEQGTVEQDDELLYDWVKVRFTGTWQDLNSEKNQEFIQIWTYQKDIDAEQWLIHDIEQITTHSRHSHEIEKE